jgi:hypothetical protein
MARQGGPKVSIDLGQLRQGSQQAGLQGQRTSLYRTGYGGRRAAGGAGRAGRRPARRCLHRRRAACVLEGRRGHSPCASTAALNPPLSPPAAATPPPHRQ